MAPTLRTTLLLTLTLVWSGSDSVEAQWRAGATSDSDLQARVWLDRGIDPVLHPGEEVRVYYRSSGDAYVALLHIDTNGLVRLVFPSGPGELIRAREGTDYRVRFSGADDWVVGDPPGVGYFFLLASPVPFDLTSFGFSPLTGGWDLSTVGTRASRDPFLVAERFIDRLLPGWEERPFALDFSVYHVGQLYSYPRFLCYDCHGYEPFSDWNPYHQACADVRVVIYNDPYFYPATRYRGTQVVYSRPLEPGRSHFDLRERAPGEPGRPLVQARSVEGGQGVPATRGGAGLGAPWQSLEGVRSLPDLLRLVAPAPDSPSRPILERRAPGEGRVPPPRPPGGDTVPATSPPLRP